MAQQFRKKPIIIEAVQWTGKNKSEVKLFAPSVHIYEDSDYAGGSSLGMKCKIPTLEGEMEAQIGDWIIRGVKGEFYPCKPDIFESTYEGLN